jgi:3-oxoacyl-(acyl-carrier-protein) synthase
MVVVERADDAEKRGARVRAWITGRGERGDDRPRVGWGRAPSWPQAARAVREAAAGRRIDLVVSGANGTGYDDREAAALDEGLGARVPALRLGPAVGESFSLPAQRLVAAVHAVEGGEKLIHRVLVPAFAQGGANVAVVVERA